MKNTTINNNWLNDFSALDSHTVDLSAEMMKLAAQVCQSVENEQQQWQSFLDALAVAGVEQWLNQGAHSFKTTYNPQHPPNKNINLTVGNYRICVVAISDISNTQVKIPVSQSPAQSAHLYLLAEVREEVNQVVILAGLQQKQLMVLKKTEPNSDTPAAKDDVFYSIPVAAFEIEPEQILLYLTCLEPVAFQGVNQSNPFNDVSTHVINAGLWLQDQLDQVATGLNWALLPPLVPANSMRPIKTTIETVIELLSSKDVFFPPEARGASGSLTVGQVVCQLYTWVWPVEHCSQSEWSLFILLAPELSDGLPAGIQLQVSDQQGVIATEHLAEASDETYLYVQAQGTQEETFSISITLPTGEDYTLPAFGFLQTDR